MSTRCTRALATPLFAALLCGSIALVAGEAPSLLANGAFEDKAGKGLPDGWEPHPGGNGTSTSMKLEKDDGCNALHVVDRDPNAGVGLRQMLSATPGHQYAFSAEVKGGSIFLYLRFYDKDKHLVGPEQRMPAPPRAEWKRRTFRLAAPPNTVFLDTWLYSASTEVTDVLVRKPELRDEGVAEKKTGPLTADKEFFEALNLDFEGLGDVKAAVAKGDLAAAKAAYLEFRRTGSKARWRLDWRPDKPAEETVFPAPMPKAAAAASDESADKIMRHMFAMPWGTDTKPYNVGEKINWEFNPRKSDDPSHSREWTYIAMSRMYQWITLGDAYWRTLGEKYAREWVAQMESWIADNPVAMEAGPGDTLTWRTIETAIRINGAWPYAYYHFLNSAAFTPEAHATFMKSVLEHGQRLRAVLDDFPERSGNWVCMECRALGMIGVLYPELKASPEFLKAGVDRLYRELSAQVYPDGGQVELTTSYHNVAREDFAGLAKIAGLNKAAVPADYMDRLKAMYRWNLRLMDQEGYLPPLNDCDPAVPVRKTLQEAAEIWGDEEFKFGATLGAEGVAPPLSSFLPYSGYAAMRSGWKKDDLYVFFDGGPVGVAHWHEDMLNVYLRAFGKVLLAEAGGYSYDKSPMRRYVLGTTAHNTVTVDGKEQRRGADGAKPVMEPCKAVWSSSPLCDYVSATYDVGYQDAKYAPVEYFPMQYVGAKDKSVAHTRHVVFLKPYCVLVVDILSGTGEHRYDAYFHLDAPDAQLDEATKAVHTVCRDKAQLAVIPLDTEGLRAKIVKGQQEPLLGWIAWEKRPIPTVVYTKQRAAPATFATLLYPYNGDAPAVTATISGQAQTSYGVTISLPDEQVIVTSNAAAQGASDAKVIVVRTPKGKPAWKGLFGVTKHSDGNGVSFSVSAPLDLVCVQAANGTSWMLHNPMPKEVRLSVTKPFAREVKLAPGAWTECTVERDSVLERGPVLFAK